MHNHLEGLKITDKTPEGAFNHWNFVIPDYIPKIMEKYGGSGIREWIYEPPNKTEDAEF